MSNPSQDWIKTRESQDEEAIAQKESPNDNGSSATAKPKLQYVPAPDDPALVKSVCPICQDQLEMKWLDEAQEWVWMDAQQVGKRIYHASCYAEATKDGDAAAAAAKKEREKSLVKPEGLGLENTASWTSGVLGKRKAEGDEGDGEAKTRIKLED